MKMKKALSILLGFILLLGSTAALAEKMKLPDVPKERLEVYYQDLYDKALKKFGSALTRQEKYAANSIHDDIASHSVAAEDHDFMKYEILGLDSAEKLKAFINNGFFGDKHDAATCEKILQRVDETIAHFTAQKRRFHYVHLREGFKDDAIAIGHVALKNGDEIEFLYHIDDMRLEYAQYTPSLIKKIRGKAEMADADMVKKVSDAAEAMIKTMGYTPYKKDPIRVEVGLTARKGRKMANILYKYSHASLPAETPYEEARLLLDLGSMHFLGVYDSVGTAEMYFESEYPSY